MKNKLATIVSSILHPLLMPVYGTVSLLFMDYFYFYSVFQKLYIVLLVGTFTCLLPFSALWLLKKAGYISSFKVEPRKERHGVYVASLLSYLICIGKLWQFGVPAWVLSLIISAFVAVLILAVINVFWKISIHAAAAGCLAGGTLFVAILLHVNLLWYLALVILLGGGVMSARLQLQAHSLPQVLTGYAVGLFFTAAFSFFL